MTTPESLVPDLIELLEVEEIDTDLYRGARLPGGEGRVFGGQVIAQALQAAQRSTDPAKSAHSLHAYFMRAGDDALPIIYRVVNDFEGRSFATRRVIAIQRGEPIFNMAASFHVAEAGFHHQAPMPDAPAPETLMPEREFFAMIADELPADRREFLLRARPIEVRRSRPRHLIAPDPRPPLQMNWFRVVAPVPDAPALHRALLAYASDMTLLGTSLLPHGVTFMSPGMQSASLDHAIWFHAPFRADEWLLYVADSPWAGHARGFSRGSIYSRDGTLVASIAQEGLIRRRPQAHVPPAT